MNELERELSRTLTTCGVFPRARRVASRPFCSTAYLACNFIKRILRFYRLATTVNPPPERYLRRVNAINCSAEISPRLIPWALETPARARSTPRRRRPGSIFYDLHVSSSYVYLREFSHAPVSKASLSCMRYCVWIVKDIDPAGNLCTQRKCARASAHIHVRSRYNSRARRVGQPRVCLR